jgi:rhodanese-related sulfurtransferase
MPSVPRISPQEALAKMSEGYTYVDVRTEEEFAETHPAGAFNVPWQVRGANGLEPNPDFVALMEKLFGKDGKLVLGCRSGNRSLKAANQLVAAGFTNVIDQRAGMVGIKGSFGELVEQGWPGAGLPTDAGAPAGRSYADLKKK